MFLTFKSNCVAESTIIFLLKLLVVFMVVGVLGGCGTTTQRTATEQLLMSDAVDTAISKIDFSSLDGRKVYLDTIYLNQVPGIGFVNSSYIISAIRQQMTASGCLLQDSKQTLSFVDGLPKLRIGVVESPMLCNRYSLPISKNRIGTISLICYLPICNVHGLLSSKMFLTFKSNCVAESTIIFLLKLLVVFMVVGVLGGCGTTTQRTATEQLLMSDAVDTAISKIDFSSLDGRKVYLDTIYLNQVPGIGFVNSSYIISAIRQQMTASGCLLQDSKQDSEIVVEARAGTLGTDGHEITYGVPQTSALSSAASLVSSSAAVPVLPELSLGRLDFQAGVAKIALFAYEKETKQPVWQSGIARAESSSRNTWILGAGPFQGGTIHGGVKFAGSRVAKIKRNDPSAIDISYFAQHVFRGPGVTTIRTARNNLEPINQPAVTATDDQQTTAGSSKQETQSDSHPNP